MLGYLASDDRQLIVSDLLLKGTVDLEPYNKIQTMLYDENDTTFIDHYHSFWPASGELPETYFRTDQIHLNYGGIRILLQNIEKHCKVIGPTVSSRAESLIHTRRSMPVAGTRYHFSSRYCHICSMRKHNTHDCCLMPDIPEYHTVLYIRMKQGIYNIILKRPQNYLMNKKTAPHICMVVKLWQKCLTVLTFLSKVPIKSS